MCVSPIRIPNPNYGNKTPIIVKTKDTVSRYINIPCGVCAECISKRQMEVVQRARAMSLDHYIFFCTLTYDNKHLPSITTSTGFDIKYADISDFQNFIKRLRKYNAFGREFKFYACSERGSQRGRPHFHCLFFIPRYPADDNLFPAIMEPKFRSLIIKEWRRNVALPVWSEKRQKFIPNARGAKYEPLFTYHSKYVGGKLYSNFDFHYVTLHSTEKGADDVAFYVTKYLLKPSSKEIRLQQALRLNLGKHEFEEVWSTVKSRCLCSKAFGDSTFAELEHIANGIERSRHNSEGFKFFLADGSSQPLSKFYRKYISPSQALDSVVATGGPVFNDERSSDSKVQSIARGERKKEIVSKRDISELF